MPDTRSDAPLTLRAAAALAGISHWALKRRFRAHEAATGARLTFRHGARGRLYTTVDLCRAAFGDDFARTPTDAERLDALERKLRVMRSDLNALARRLTKIFSKLDLLSQARAATQKT